MNNMSNTSFDGLDDQRKDNNSEQLHNDISAKEISDEFLSATNNSRKGNLYPFPYEVFPLEMQEIIKYTNESLNYPIDFISASMLYASSLVIGNTYRVEVKKSWIESPLLFIVNVGAPGSNKSHPLDFALKPILERQAKNYAEYQQKNKEYERVLNLSKDERDEEGVEELVKPFWERYTVTDFTPEALNQVHKANKRCTGVYADELAAWFKNFNRYHNGADQEFWLSAWSTKQITIDRKTGEPIFIPLPFIPVGGNIQPTILSELAKDRRAHNGFMDRILYAFPQGLKKPYINENEISDELIDRWKSVIDNLFKLDLKFDEFLNPQPEILRFNPTAREKFYAWSYYNTDLCNNTESEETKGIYIKLENYAIRLALILEILKWACEGESARPLENIGIEAVDGALKLIEYFRQTALMVNSIISSYNPLDKLAADKRKLYQALPGTFTTAEGLKIAEVNDTPHDTFHKWLRIDTQNKLFRKIKQGNYEKLF